MANREKNVFVIMPFSATENHSAEEWLEIYENLFVPAVEACGFACERAVPRTGSLISSIIESLHSARIVLADVTDHNPNVFYELGVRHSLSTRTIIACQDADQIPSDLRGNWSLVYSTSLSGATKFKHDMERIIEELDTEPEKTDSPVADYLERENMTAFRHVQRDNIKKLGALLTEISGNRLTLEQIHHQPDDMIARQLVVTSSLDRLLTTLYVDIGPDLLKSAYEVLFHLKRIALGDQSTTIHQAANGCLEVLNDGVSAIRDKLISHEYEEPSTVSTMGWASPGSDTLECQSYTALHGFHAHCKIFRCSMTRKNVQSHEEEKSPEPDEGK